MLTHSANHSANTITHWVGTGLTRLALSTLMLGKAHQWVVLLGTNLLCDAPTASWGWPCLCSSPMSLCKQSLIAFHAFER